MQTPPRPHGYHGISREAKAGLNKKNPLNTPSKAKAPAEVSRNNLHSRLWHGFRRDGILKGMGEAEAKAFAKSETAKAMKAQSL